MKDSHDVGPVCSRFVQGDDIVVSEHYDSLLFVYVWYPSRDRGVVGCCRATRCMVLHLFIVYK